MADLRITQMIKLFPTNGNIMPSLRDKLVGLGPICDANCNVSPPPKYVTVFLPKTKPSSQDGMIPQAPSYGAL